MQLILKKNRIKKQKKIKKPALQQCPQKSSQCELFLIRAPKKPNSAKRKTTKVELSNNKRIWCYLPGQGYSLQRYSELLIRGGRKQDLPGIKYSAIRGVFAFTAVKNRKTARSRYGVKKKVNEVL